METFVSVLTGEAFRGGDKVKGCWGIYDDEGESVFIVIDFVVVYNGVKYYQLTNGRYLPCKLYHRALDKGLTVSRKWEVALEMEVEK